ncbi:MAG TPA: hypothetical protein VFE59_32320 [Trebonia sp.]|nr:hypothetical protein [Trebonia sp.]
MISRVPSLPCAATRTLISPASPVNRATNGVAGWLYTSSGVPDWTRTPSSSTPTTSASANASAWSCVMYTVVAPASRTSEEISTRIRSRRSASRLDSGSSHRISPVSAISALASETRCCWPPDSSFG